MKILVFGCSILIASVATTFLAFRVPQYESPADAAWWRDATRLDIDTKADPRGAGSSVAISGDLALVGMDSSDALGRCAGAAYSFSPGFAAPVSILGTDDADEFGDLGVSIAACGDIAIVGKPGDTAKGEDAGAALIFQKDRRGQWHRSAKLLGNDVQPADRFGDAVALTNRFALVAARGLHNSGAVYVFEQDTQGAWRQTAKLKPEQGTSGDGFGWSVAVNENLAVVGAPTDKFEEQFEAGAAYIFKRETDGTWHQLARLAPSDSRSYQHFGRSVATHGAKIAVGAPLTNDSSGIVYFYEADTNGQWKNVGRIAPQVPVKCGCFGKSIAMNARYLAVGAPSDSYARGAVYLFHAENVADLSQLVKIVLPNRPMDSWFGSSIAMNDRLFVAGARSARNTAAAYLFQLDDGRR